MGISAIGTLVLFFLNGVAITKLSDKALLYLTGATVAELAGMMFIVLRWLFPKHRIHMLAYEDSKKELKSHSVPRQNWSTPEIKHR
jgi:hypothetical protein